jgi:hypothetical protein
MDQGGWGMSAGACPRAAAGGRVLPLGTWQAPARRVRLSGVQRQFACSCASTPQGLLRPAASSPAGAKAGGYPDGAGGVGWLAAEEGEGDPGSGSSDTGEGSSTACRPLMGVCVLLACCAGPWVGQ